MSALHAPAVAPARRPATRPARPAAPARPPLSALPGGLANPTRRLDAVRAPLAARSSAPFTVLCGVILAVALVAALLLNTAMARGSYELASLQREAAQVAQDVQTKQEDLRAAEAGLAATAKRLGMVPADNPTMISVETGKVVGTKSK